MHETFEVKKEGPNAMNHNEEHHSIFRIIRVTGLTTAPPGDQFEDVHRLDQMSIKMRRNMFDCVSIKIYVSMIWSLMKSSRDTHVFIH